MSNGFSLTYLFLKTKKTDEIVCVYAFDESRFGSKEGLLRAVLAEKRNIEQLFPPADYQIEQVSGYDLSSVSRLFPEILGRTNVEELAEKIIPVDISEYVEFSLKYYIEADGRDRIIHRGVIKGGTIPISFIRRHIGVIGDAEHQKNFKDLELKATTSGDNQIRFQELGRWGSSFLLGLYLWPPVQAGDSREYTVDHIWKGMWKPFRETGKDQGSVDIGVSVKRLEIGVVLPPGISGTMKGYGKVGELLTESEGDRSVLIWRILQAPPGRFNFEVIRSGA